MVDSVNMFIIYGLYEAGNPEEIRYVGCTKQTLPARLLWHSRRTTASNPRVHSWLLETAVEGRILQQTNHEPYARDLEKRWIVRLARQGNQLFNWAHNPKVLQTRNKPVRELWPENKTLGNKAVTNFLQYLRALPIVLM